MVELDWKTGNAWSTEKEKTLNTKKLSKTMHRISILENE
jgi:hypothetical protein